MDQVYSLSDIRPLLIIQEEKSDEKEMERIRFNYCDVSTDSL